MKIYVRGIISTALAHFHLKSAIYFVVLHRIALDIASGQHRTDTTMASARTLRSQQEVFDQRVIPYAKEQFNLDLSQYSSLEKCTELLKDLFLICRSIRQENIQPLMGEVSGLYRKHQNLILPFVGIAVDYVLAQLPIDETFRQVVIGKIQFILQSISVSFRFALVFVFLFQCYEMYTINESIKEAMKSKFELIVKNVEELKIIADTVDQLIILYKEASDEYERDQLWELIQSKLEQATDNEYRETTEAIVELRAKIEVQRQMLEQSRSVALTGGVMSSFGIPICLLALEAVPVVGTIATVASFASYTYSITTAAIVKQKLNKITQNLDLLSKYENDLDEVMHRIKKQGEWRDRMTELDFEL